MLIGLVRLADYIIRLKITMNKMRDRKKAKALIIASLIVKIEICKSKLRTAADHVEYFGLFHQCVQLDSHLSHVKTVDFRALRTDGVIDNRRYRRFVTKHKPFLKIKQQTKRLEVNMTKAT